MLVTRARRVARGGVRVEGGGEAAAGAGGRDGAARGGLARVLAGCVVCRCLRR